MVVATTGFFDGVHMGHAEVIAQLCRTARAEQKKSAVITFWPHPRDILRQDSHGLRLLTSLDEKKEILLNMGVDDVHVIDFTKEFSLLSAENFISEYLISKFKVSTLIVGYDHHFGHNKEGKGPVIEEIAARAGIKTVRIPAVSDEYNAVSSTYIRNLIGAGGVERANSLLGYNFFLSGVITGCETGSDGMHITTQLYCPLKILPEDGCYEVQVFLEGMKRDGICMIEKGTVKTYLPSVDEDVFGLDIRIAFVARK